MIRFFTAHPTAANILMLLLMVIGIVSAPSLVRQTFPDFSQSSVQVTVAYPGATAEEIEDAICQRVEDAVANVTFIDEIRCLTREGSAAVTIDMQEEGDIATFLAEIKTEVEAIDNFPDLAEDPAVRQLNKTDSVIQIAITGPMSAPHLKVYAEEIKDRLLRLSLVSLVELDGFPDRQLRIEPRQSALREYGLTISSIADIVAKQSLDLPSGAIEARDKEVLLRFADERKGIQELENLVVIGGETGAEVTLGQIARVTDRFEDDEDKILFNGERAAILQITKTKSEDALRIKAEIEAFINEVQASAPEGVHFTLTRDVTSIVEDRLSMLTKNAVQGLLLVFLVMWAFFNIRLSFWAVMGLPISFLGTVALMVAMGFTLNMLSMVGLLIAIGIIMDDSIVIAENIATHRHRGKSAIEAAVIGTKEVFPGVLSSFATSVSVFLPLAFISGDIGKVLRVVPIVLIMTLAVSLIEAFLILPHHMLHSAGRRQDNRFRRWFDSGFERIRERFLGRAIDRLIEWRYLTIGIVLMLFLASVAMPASGLLRFKAFPDLDGDIVQARLLLPQGTPLTQTEIQVDRILNALKETEAVFADQMPEGERLVVNTNVAFNSNPDTNEVGPHLATVTVDLLTAERRGLSIDEITGLWREKIGIVPDAIALSVAEPSLGPAGAPIDIRLYGSDLAELEKASLELMAKLESYQGVFDLKNDLRPGKPELLITLKEGATELGLDADRIARQMRAAFQGTTASEIQVGSESYEIDVRLAQDDQNSLGDLDYFVVTAPDGTQVPFTSIADVERGRGYSQITRIDGLRAVTVKGDLDPALTNMNQIMADLRSGFFTEMQQRYPSVTLGLEGEAAEQAETATSMLRGFGLGILGVFLLLSFQFRSYLEPIVVMLAIPMAFIGSIWGHVIMGLDFSMPSMLGFASLAGIVVNDSILLVTFIKMRAKETTDLSVAARQASRDRFRAVLLTSLTTIAGMLPLLFETSFQAQVLVPLVTSLSFGLMASTLLVLLIVPVLYTILADFGLTNHAMDEDDQGEEMKVKIE
ncbi:efflux RND transporter permease subunit [Aestuariispira insulae]|uniref:Multidrug efflux pump subunit AcrB n=1 Tax=Aestuariispira insulae TaxID=1461337 RepID=A0A3D9HW89_9PROT|nr:efflux RND transporter permease subunit [Aestuariispira insulae]RED53679.1 multidrug efflux pump subunit AcrB [Aestuariispira insulae]